MNLKEVFEVMDKFDKSGLGELEIKLGDSTVVLKKPAPVVAAPQMFAPPPYAGGYHAPQGGHAPAAPAEPAAPKAKEGVELITSPIVGTFYRAAAPDTPPFVDVGTRVEKGGTVCILEAMKVMNRLESEFACEILAILVENGQMLEYGTPIFEVKRI